MTSAFEHLPFRPADILLPQNCDYDKWSVVACDQYTSQPEYWQRVEETVGSAPSALRLILPESCLDGPNVETDCLIYVERRLDNLRLRRGIIGMVDLEQYDYEPDANALVRATEGTVLSRIPPRVAVRKNAPLELPHAMLLADDPAKTVIEPLAEQKGRLEKVYDFDLMERGGHIAGWKLDEAAMEGVAAALSALADPSAFRARYGVSNAGVMLSRFALCELVNLHDASLEFEPIHRVLFGVEPEEVVEALLTCYPGAYRGEGDGHVLRYVCQDSHGAVTVPHPDHQLEVGTLQNFLDAYLKEHPGRIDYIHGSDVARNLAAKPERMAFLLPAMGKDQLFPTVLHDGVLPRKTFSMGQAHDKRFYLEARKIRT